MDNMLYNLYHFVHDSWGLCFWDLPTLFVAIVMVVVVIVHCHNQKKRQKKLDEAREEKLEALKNPAPEAPVEA